MGPSIKDVSVIVMTFWYVFIGTDLIFSFFFIYYSFGIGHDPHVHYVHMTYVYSLSHMFSHDHVAKRSHYRIMIFYDFGVLFYGRIPTLIFF